MTHLIDWLMAASWLGLDRLGWLMIFSLLVVETYLGKHKQARYRSVLMATANLILFILGLIPGAGPVMARVFSAFGLVPPPDAPGLPPPPPAATAILLFLGVGMLNGCPHNTPAPPILTTVIDCTVEAVRTVATDLLGDVATALASGDWQGQLTQLVIKFGEAAVDCAVRQVGNEASASARLATSDQLAITRSQNAQAWLAQRQAKFVDH